MVVALHRDRGHVNGGDLDGELQGLLVPFGRFAGP